MSGSLKNYQPYKTPDNINHVLTRFLDKAERDLNLLILQSLQKCIDKNGTVIFTKVLNFFTIVINGVLNNHIEYYQCISKFIPVFKKNFPMILDSVDYLTKLQEFVKLRQMWIDIKITQGAFEMNDDNMILCKTTIDTLSLLDVILS